MNIVVVLRALRDPAGFTVNRKAQKIFVNRESYLLNPADRNALEAALVLGDHGHAVTAVTYGGEPAETAARQARALGAAGALWIREPKLSRTPAGAMVEVLERAMSHLGGADLVLLGNEVLDADLAQVGPRLAAALDWPFIGSAAAVEVPAAGGAVVEAVVGDQDQGYRRVQTDAPAVVAVARDSNRPRYAPAAQIITVFSEADSIEMVGLDELGLTEGDLDAGVETRGESFPPERELGRPLEGTPDDLAQAVVAALRQP